MSAPEKPEKINTLKDEDLMFSKESSSGSSSHEKKKGFFSASAENTIHRKLENRHIQLIAIGGAIGTGIFITIGGALIKGGPLSLLLAYLFQTTVILLLTCAVGEMVSYMPVASPFISMAGRTIDEALEFACGWNFYLMESLYIPFEIVAVNGMIHYWRDDYSAAIPLAVQIVLYVGINVFAVRLFGEAEFWLSIGKLLLLVMLLFYTFITMVGGNPTHHAFGFSNWDAVGGPMAEYIHKGDLGRFQGLLAAWIQSAFTVVGPEYMSMVAAEAKNPRKNMPIAFKTVLYRLVTFYIGGALSVGILVAYNDPLFVQYNSAGGNAAASPYVVSMINLGIKGFPHFINAIIITSAFSAGNSYVYCSSRVLYSLSRRGFAPKFFSYCNSSGVPVFCIALAVCFSMLSLMQLGSGSATALGYITSICTGSQLLNYVYMAITYIGFHRACNAQGIDRSGFTYTAWFQPYGVYFSLFFLVILVGILGYENFLPGHWDTASFLTNYLMVFVSIGLAAFWKLFAKTKFVKPEEADLVTGLDEIEQHEYEYYANLKVDEDDYKPSAFKRALNWVF